MPEPDTINAVIAEAFASSIYISSATREKLEARFDQALLDQLDAILHDSTWPSDPWVTATSLTEAARKVEPVLREKYPELNEASLTKILNYACFSWK